VETEPWCHWNTRQIPWEFTACAISFVASLWLLQTISRCRKRLLGKLLINLAVCEMIIDAFSIAQRSADVVGYCYGWNVYVDRASNATEVLGQFGHVALSAWCTYVAVVMVMCAARAAHSLKYFEKSLRFCWMIPMLVTALSALIVRDGAKERDRNYRLGSALGIGICCGLILGTAVALEIYRRLRARVVTHYVLRVSNYTRGLLVSFLAVLVPRMFCIVLFTLKKPVFVGTVEYAVLNTIISVLGICVPLAVAIIMDRVPFFRQGGQGPNPRIIGSSVEGVELDSAAGRVVQISMMHREETHSEVDLDRQLQHLPEEYDNVMRWNHLYLADRPSTYTQSQYAQDQKVVEEIRGTPEGDRQALFLGVCAMFPTVTRQQQRRKRRARRAAGDERFTEECHPPEEGTYAQRYYYNWGRTLSGSDLTHVSGPSLSLGGASSRTVCYAAAVMVLMFFVLMIYFSQEDHKTPSPAPAPAHAF